LNCARPHAEHSSATPQRRSEAQRPHHNQQCQQARAAAAAATRRTQRRLAELWRNPTPNDRTRQRRACVGGRTLSLASLSAPCSSSSRTHSVWPKHAARCSGVIPSCAPPHTANSSATPQRRSDAHTAALRSAASAGAGRGGDAARASRR
jgi:hypothetical protein